MDVYPVLVNHVNESLPPPYSSQASDSDWKHEIIEVKSLNTSFNKYGFVISGGIDNENGPWIIITHIESLSKYSFDNGRRQLRLFDRIISINGTDLTQITHDDAARAITSAQGRSIRLHICRLNPRHIESIDVHFPSDMIDSSIGITISGGLDNNIVDPGLFITHIDPNCFLASCKQFRLHDRLLEIKTNCTSANLRYLTHSRGVRLIRRICEDDKRVTFVVAHQ